MLKQSLLFQSAWFVFSFSFLSISCLQKAPIKPVVPRKQAPIIRQVQLQKSRPEDGVSAEELMRQSELASAQAEAARRKAIMEKEQSSCEMPVRLLFKRGMFKCFRSTTLCLVLPYRHPNPLDLVANH